MNGQPTSFNNIWEGSETANSSSPAGEAKRGSDPQPFPIVGIGASAGGMAAFEAFFSGMPDDIDPGMAFVLVQHLSPDHESILTELVRRYTRMQVFEVEDGMVVRPNCAYIIPPGRNMAFLNGALQLLEPSAPRGQRMPIDFFFRSLAQDQRERAIGIILSGTGSDGTLGARAIKGEGGMVMAQNPASTKYDGMPRSAIAAGLVDYELPPAEMPAQLMAYMNHAFSVSPQAQAILKSRAENTLKKIFILLRNQTGHDFSQYKISTVQRRIERRMAVQQIETMEEYVRYMQQNRVEVEALFRDMLIGVTSFFRDPDAFYSLKEQVIPEIFADKKVDGVVRVWVPGCATGEEAYTLAILLAENQEKLKRSYKLQIFATDIDIQAITTARAGLYPASITADITPDRLARFFTAEPDNNAYRIHKTIRDMLIFSEQNVIKDPPFSRLDLISCRNLLIYMSGDLQKRIIPLFHYALKPGGFLFLGTSETVGEFGDLFKTLDRKSKLYQRKDGFHGVWHTSTGRFLPSLPLEDAPRIPSAIKMPDLNKRSLREVTEQTLLQHITSAAVLVNHRGDILYLHGRTGQYLELAPGDAGVNNILKMARTGLRRDLAAGLRQAVASKEIIKRADLYIKTNGGFVAVNLTVCPVHSGANADPDSTLYLVILQQADSSVGLPVKAPAPSQGDNKKGEKNPTIEARITALQQELQAKEETLQIIIEELETSNEELNSSNEEMQTINEELQSANEELETSKEELQSVNEELVTVNAELQTKVADLSQSNNDMNNLLAGTGIATVFVDTSLNILRFTPTATRLINLIQSDVGRPAAHIVSNLVGYNNLLADTQAVLDTLLSKEMDVQTKSGSWYRMRIQPYRTLENVIEGAVITFMDISEAREAQVKLREREASFRRALKGSPGEEEISAETDVSEPNSQDQEEQEMAEIPPEDSGEVK